jgi:ribosomal protein L21E
MGNSYEVLVDKFKRTRELGTAKRKGQDNIKVDIKEREYEVTDRIKLTDSFIVGMPLTAFQGRLYSTGLIRSKHS